MSGREGDLRATAVRLLESGSVAVVIGYGNGTLGRRRPVFVRTPAQADELVFDDECHQNLATYLLKPEVRRLGRPAMVAIPSVLRSLVQLTSERQLKDGEVVALVVGADGAVHELADLAAVRQHLAGLPGSLHPAARAEIARLSAMTAAERRAFWSAELGRCIKCYACRASCPMCYCERCTTECNRPQWIPVASHGLGNLEYHLMRAMHLAGRCVECATCSRACPVGIPVHLLAVFAEESVRRQFGAEAGAAGAAYALSSFRPEDQEGFIR
jgi:ferredoxin